MLAAVLVTGAVFTVLDPRFLAIGNVGNIASQISFEGVLAVTMTFVLISGEIDLSIGSMVGLTGVVFGILLQTYHVPIWPAVILTLLSGCVMGAVNGGLSVLLRVPTIIITLGMLSAYRGFAYFISNGYPVENFSKASVFFAIGQDRLFHIIPYDAMVLVVFAVIGAVVLRQTVIGHRIYAIGSGTVLASVLGMLLLGMIRNGLVLVGVSIYLLIVVSGLIVIVAVAIDRFYTRRRQVGGGVDSG